MRLERLVMENFGPFSGRAELDFSRLDDIFLISGKTGAGKTTIFDAICFALYGKVPGSRGDHPTRLRSDHAVDGGGCFVSLEFSLGGKRFLAERCPRQERPKKRGEGTVSIDETLALFEITGSTKTLSTSKKTEGDARLKELIGLEAEEFFKIVLLPQGEFAEFLKEKTSERQKVLGKLFPVENVVRVKELARKKAADAEALAKGASHILEDLMRRVSPGTYETTRSEAAMALNEAEKKSLELEREETLLGQILALRKNETAAEQRLEESRGLLGEIIDTEASIKKKSEALSRSRSARPLEQFIRGLESADAGAREAEAALIEAVMEKEAAEKTLAEAESLFGETSVLEKEVRSLSGKRPALAEMLEEEKKLASMNEDLKRQETFTEELSAEICLLITELEKQESAIKIAEDLAAEQSTLEGKNELSKTIKDLFMEFRKFRERWDDLEKVHANTEKEIAELKHRTGEYEKNIPVLEAELKGLREEKTRIENADMAAHLSALLEEGKPCPVCGSVEHPHKASCADSPFGFDERIKAQEASLMEAEKSMTAVSVALDVKKEEKHKNRENIDILQNEINERRQVAINVLPPEYLSNSEYLVCLESGAALPSVEIINRVIENEEEILKEILRRLKISRDAAVQRGEYYRRKEAIQGKKNEADKRLTAAEEQKKNLVVQIAGNREKHKTLLKSVGEIFASNAFFKEPFPGASGALVALDRIINEKETLISRYREERENALLSLSRATAAWEGALRIQSDSGVRRKDAYAALEKAVSATDFSSPEEAEKALLGPDAEEEFEGEIRQWRESRAGLDTQIAEQEKQLDGIRRELTGLSTERIPSLLEVGQRLEALKEERVAAEEERNRTFSVLRGLESDKAALDEAQKRHAALVMSAKKFKTLADDLSGKNPLKLPFDSWLLGKYLVEAAAYATIRLEKMSEGRYSLLLDTDKQLGRGYAGLDLMVFDAHTGKTRPCATLSGGESFMASISLALGLADAIQNRSGGVRLDAVFIDEGFGSLDETSLDKALVILDELRASRMVGLISHVGELRSRIPCRVEVVKTAAGSRIAMRE